MDSSENRDGDGNGNADAAVGGHSVAAVDSILEQEGSDSARRVPAATKWGMAGLLLVYTGLGSYALVSTIGAGPAHPEGVTRSGAIALGKSAGTSRAGAAATARVPASDADNWWSNLANIKSASSASSASAGMVTAPAQPAASSAPPDEVLTAISAVAVGPDGTSDGDHPGLAALALDQDSSMSWATHWYESPYFGNLQDGTGLLLDMGRTVTIKRIELALGGSPGFWGADLQIRVGDSTDLMSLAPVATATDAGGWVTADLGTPATGRYVQVWFTKLPKDQQGTFQEHVYGITVHGSAPRPSSRSASWVNIHTTARTASRSPGAHSGGGFGHGAYGHGGPGGYGHGNGGYGGGANSGGGHGSSGHDGGVNGGGGHDGGGGHGGGGPGTHGGGDGPGSHGGGYGGGNAGGGH